MSPTRDVGCVICGEAPDTELEHEGHFLFGARTLKAVLMKIFQHLLIPSNDAQILYWICRDERFCPSCLSVVEEIEEFQSKIQALELALQHKVELLGSVIARSSKFNDKDYERRAMRSTSEKVVELWNKFRNPVLQNYKKGLLPNPSVPMVKTVDTTVRLKRSAGESKEVASKRSRKEFLVVEDDDGTNGGVDDNLQSMGDFVDPDISYDDAGSDSDGDNYVPEDEDEDGSANEKLDKLVPCFVERDPSHAELPNGSALITSYDCPKCNFSSPFDISECKNNGIAWRMLTRAKGILTRHYAKTHCPVRVEDLIIDKDKKESYNCSLCSEKIVVEFSPNSCPKNRRRMSHIRLSRHYLNIHDIVKEPPRPAWLKPEGDTLDGLLEGLDYFRCPMEMCSYVSKLSQSKDRRTGLPKLANHYMRMHEVKGWCKTEKDGKYPCLVKVSGERQKFKCPRCKYSVEVKRTQNENSNIKRKAYSTLLDHFIQHVYSPPKAKSAMQCTLCEEVIRFPNEWTPKRPADGERKMRGLLVKHYRKVHLTDEIPQFEYYERISSSLSQSQPTNSNDSELSEDALLQAVESLQERTSPRQSPQKQEFTSRSYTRASDEIIPSIPIRIRIRIRIYCETAHE